MSSPAAAKPVAIEQYLSNPSYEHFEYIDGSPIELNMGGGPHSIVQANCTALLANYLKQNQIGRVATELRCRLQVSGHTRFYLPDVCVVLGGDQLVQKKTRFLDRSPELVVEIRSPDDSLPQLFRKIDDYIANGAKTAWLILPEDECVFVLTPNGPMRTALAGESLDGGSLLPGLKIPVDELFS